MAIITSNICNDWVIISSKSRSRKDASSPNEERSDTDGKKGDDDSFSSEEQTAVSARQELRMCCRKGSRRRCRQGGSRGGKDMAFWPEARERRDDTARVDRAADIMVAFCSFLARVVECC
jgi:hypothetical protein